MKLQIIYLQWHCNLFGINLFITMKVAMHQFSLSEILEKPYEYRTHQENEEIKRIIANKTQLPYRLIDKISLYLKPHIHSEQSQVPPDAFIFTLQQSSQTLSSNDEDLVYWISQQQMRRCKFMVGSGWQQQIRFWTGVGDLKQIGKRKIYDIIRHIEIFPYLFNEVLPEDDAQQYIYIVRQGDFSFCCRKSFSRQVEILTISQGYLFKKCVLGDIYMKCRSSKGFIYRLPKIYFDTFLTNYMEKYLQSLQNQLHSFIQSRTKLIDSQKHSKQLPRHASPNLSKGLQMFRSKSISFCRQISIPKQEIHAIDIEKIKFDYRSLKKQKLPKNKLYNKGEILYMVNKPTDNQSDLLMWKKSKSMKLRELCGKYSVTRQELLGKFVESTIAFNKKKRIGQKGE